MINYVGNFTDAMKIYTEEKLNKVLALGNFDDIKVAYKSFNDETIVEISLNNKFRATKSGEDFYAIVTLLVEKLCTQIVKKNKMKEKLADAEYDDISEDPIVAREKFLILDEMAITEAIDMMEALGHTFFIYKDVDNNDTTSVLYKRYDGTYGVISCK